MTNTPRANSVELHKKFSESKIEEGRMVYISSAWLKTCDLYQRFLHFYKSMIKGSKNYFVASLNWRVGVDAGLWTEQKIMLEREDPEMTSDKFDYELGAIFVGSSNDSYYPYEIINKCRVLNKCELQQPKNCNYDYIITHDVAVSGKNNSDNACTHVLKLIPRKDGTFTKKIVFTTIMNGASLREQKEFLRELVHVKFPNTIKLVIDKQSAGEGLLSLLAEPWSYQNNKGEDIEYPPLLLDDDDEGLKMLNYNARPMIRGIMATSDFNNTFYPYMKTCFENGNIEILIDSAEVNQSYKEGSYKPEEYKTHVEQDLLINELTNIKRYFNQNNNLVYGRIVQKNKRDRATSLMYGLSVIFEYEKEGKANLQKDNTDTLFYLSGYIY